MPQYTPIQRASLLQMFCRMFGAFPLRGALQTADERASLLERSLRDGKPHAELVFMAPGGRFYIS